MIQVRRSNWLAASFLIGSSFLSMALATAPVSAESVVSEEGVIVVRGEGVLEKAPDQATLTIRLIATEQSLSKAKQVIDESYTRVISVLKKNGLQDSDVRTSIRARPHYEWRSNNQGKKRSYEGERIIRTLQIKISNLGLYSTIQQAVIDEGIATIENVVTGFNNEEALKTEALGLAIDHAKKKAAYLSRRFDRRLDKVLSVAEEGVIVPSGNRTFEVASYRSSRMSVPNELFGLQKITASVVVKYKLK